tara:strand:+ start:146 stop:556 length:411 start_codon:yes stop_codon:yes gene_type:complete
MEPRFIEKYRVGGDIKTNGAHETRWQFNNHEIRVRIRRGNWQYFVSAGARVTAEYDPGLHMFPEYLDVRCPTMDENELPDVRQWVENVQKTTGDTRGMIVTNERFLPRKKQFVGSSCRYRAPLDPGEPRWVKSWTE